MVVAQQPLRLALAALIGDGAYSKAEVRVAAAAIGTELVARQRRGPWTSVRQPATSHATLARARVCPAKPPHPRRTHQCSARVPIKFLESGNVTM